MRTRRGEGATRKKEVGDRRASPSLFSVSLLSASPRLRVSPSPLRFLPSTC